MREIILAVLMLGLLEGVSFGQKLTPEQQAGLDRLHYRVNTSWRISENDRIPIINQNVVVERSYSPQFNPDYPYNQWSRSDNSQGYVYVFPSYPRFHDNSHHRSPYGDSSRKGQSQGMRWK